MSDIEIIRETLTCPITQDIMIDPVQGNDGQTYDRRAILQALAIKPESPITRAPMSPSDLKVNTTIRYLLDKYNEGKLGNTSTPLVNKLARDMSDATASTTAAAIIQAKSEKLNHLLEISSNSIYNAQRTETLIDITATSKNISVDTAPDIGTDLIIVIDRSGSMGLSVEAKNNSGDAIENGFSQQDIVNHAAKTVAKSLSSIDRLGVIIFDNNVQTLFNLISMTEINISTAILKINTIRPSGQTDIWSALNIANDILYKRHDKTRNPAIIILTDGAPNISPSRGEVHALKSKRKTLDFYPPVYTFGFGYNLLPDLLYGLAFEGDGVVGHIPDGGMIATVFSNFLANIRCTVGYNLQLIVEYSGNNEPKIAGDYKTEIIPVIQTGLKKMTSSKKTSIKINIGTVQIGQSRHILIKNVKPTNYKLIYTIGNTTTQKQGVINHGIDNNKTIAKFIQHGVRYTIVEQLRIAYKLKECGQSNEKVYNDLIQFIQTELDIVDRMNTDDDIVKSQIVKMKKTIEDQLYMALSVNANHSTLFNGSTVSYFHKWGRWYIDQISRALNQEWKPNFKDEACDFGGILFNNLVDYASDQFDALPPPTPSNIIASRSQKPIIMSAYNSVDTPCFVGSSKIRLSDNSEKRVKDLIRGDKVSVLSDPYDTKSDIKEASVVCILKTITNGNVKLVTIGDNLKITPWHPILTASGWEFPGKLSKIVAEPCEAVYSILLDSGHTFMINNVWTIGLGHNYTEGILEHEYFGTNAVITDIKQLPGWSVGKVIINSRYSIMRDPITTKIISILGQGKTNI